MDHYYKIGSTNVHWVQIGCSLGAVILLGSLVFCIFKRGLDRDFANIARLQLERAQRRKARISGERGMEIESSTEPRGRATVVAWKKLYGHIFKHPAYPAIFSCMLGAGTQVFMMFYLCLNAFVFFFSVNSFRPPIFVIIMFVTACLGFVNGLVTTRTLKFFGITDWAFSAAIACIALPAFIYVSLGAEIVLYAIAGGYSRNSLFQQLGMTVGWCCLNSLSCWIGSYKGYTLRRVRAQVKVSSMPREIPP